MKNDNLIFLWNAIVEPFRSLDHLVQTCDEPGYFSLKTRNGRPFVTIRIQKQHVGMYLLPMYYHPHIVPPELSPFQNGKGSLKFKSQDGHTFTEHAEELIRHASAVIGLY